MNRGLLRGSPRGRKVPLLGYPKGRPVTPIFPTISPAAVTATATVSTTPEIYLPAGCRRNDILFGVCAFDGQPSSITYPNTWAELANPGTQLRVWFWRLCDGTDDDRPDSMVWTLGTARRLTAMVWRIRGAEPAVPAISAVSTNSATPINVGNVTIDASVARPALVLQSGRVSSAGWGTAPTPGYTTPEVSIMLPDDASNYDMVWGCYNTVVATDENPAGFTGNAAFSVLAAAFPTAIKR